MGMCTNDSRSRHGHGSMDGSGESEGCVVTCDPHTDRPDTPDRGPRCAVSAAFLLAASFRSVGSRIRNMFDLSCCRH